MRLPWKLPGNVNDKLSIPLHFPSPIFPHFYFPHPLILLNHLRCQQHARFPSSDCNPSKSASQLFPLSLTLPGTSRSRMPTALSDGAKSEKKKQEADDNSMQSIPPFSLRSLSRQSISPLDLKSSVEHQSSSMPMVSPSLHHSLASSTIAVAAALGTSPYGRKLFPCPQCRYTTDRRNNLKRHMLTMHQLSSKLLECCGVLFQTKAALREHALIFHYHGYTCFYCGRRFCRKALLKRHLTVHNGQKEFICTICDYATSHKSNLERHRRVHVRQESEECGVVDCLHLNQEGSHVVHDHDSPFQLSAAYRVENTDRPNTDPSDLHTSSDELSALSGVDDEDENVYVD